MNRAARTVCLLVCTTALSGWRIAVGAEPASDGAALARVHCVDCHLFPEPALLDKQSWLIGVLPTMGPYLGIFEHAGQTYPVTLQERQTLKIFPASPRLTSDNWRKILDYYQAEAPATLEVPPRPDIERDLELFAVTGPQDLTGANATFVKFDLRWRNLWVGLESPPALRVYDAKLRLLRRRRLPSPATAVIVDPDAVWTSCVGRVFPHDTLEGMLVRIELKGGLPVGLIEPILDQLARPVALGWAGDKLIIGEFGYRLGRLSQVEHVHDRPEKSTLLERPGAIAIHHVPLREQGPAVLLVMMTQGDESIWAFPEDGPPQQLLRLPPVYGSTWFEPVDFNGDRLTDFVVTCGDNADTSTVFKPYHGVYIFVQNDDEPASEPLDREDDIMDATPAGPTFDQAFFFPMNGAFKALARDFDLDGDLDLVAIATFANYRTAPEEGFVYLEHQGGLTFKPRTSSNLLGGRWLTMDAADIDHDGDCDVVLGNFPRAPLLANAHQSDQGVDAPAFLLLLNRTR